MVAERGSWWGHLRTLVLFAIMGGILYEMHRRELEQSRQEEQAKQAKQAAPTRPTGWRRRSAARGR